VGAQFFLVGGVGPVVLQRKMADFNKIECDLATKGIRKRVTGGGREENQSSIDLIFEEQAG